VPDAGIVNNMVDGQEIRVAKFSHILHAMSFVEDVALRPVNQGVLAAVGQVAEIFVELGAALLEGATRRSQTLCSQVVSCTTCGGNPKEDSHEW
jgi:hypothetical protein